MSKIEYGTLEQIAETEIGEVFDHKGLHFQVTEEDKRGLDILISMHDAKIFPPEYPVWKIIGAMQSMIFYLMLEGCDKTAKDVLLEQSND